MKLLTTLALLFISFIPALGSAQLGGASNSPSLLVRVTDAGSTAQVGSLGFGETGFGLVSDVRSVSYSPSALPLSSSYATRAQLQAALSPGQVDVFAAALSAELSAYMSDFGLSYAWYAFERTISITSGPDQVVTWTLFQDAAGRASYGAPQVVAADSADVRVLHVRYRALSLPQGMDTHPTGYTGAGLLQWQVLDSELDPVSAPASLATGGAFDSPLEGADPQQGLQCLIDSSRSGCTPFAEDVKSLIASTGASMVFVDYGYAPEPRYTLRADSLCPGGGTCFVPELFYRFTERSLTYLDCGYDATYSVSGNYRTDIEAITDRFMVDPQALEATALQRFTETFDPLVEPFSHSERLSGSALAGMFPASPYVIEPHVGNALVNANALPGTVELLADITVGEMVCPPVTASVSPGAHNVATTGTFTVTPGGGRGPYSYQWHPVADYAGGSYAIGSPYSQTTTIQRVGGSTMGPSGGTVGFVDVRVTDSRGEQATARVTMVINPDPPPPPPPLTIHVNTAQASWSSTYGMYGSAGSCSSTASTCTATTQPAPITVSGGEGSYYASWAHISGTGATAHNSASVNTIFSRTGSGTQDGVFRLTVWDGNSSDTQDISVRTSHVQTCPSPEASFPASRYTSGNDNVFSLNANGTMHANTGYSVPTPLRWLPAGRSASDYEVRVTHNGLAFWFEPYWSQNHTYNTWVNLGGGFSMPGIPPQICTSNEPYGQLWTIQIRSACTGQIVATTELFTQWGRCGGPR